jgi:hypothetical protein
MSEPYAGWAIVEIMGHQTFAGLVKPEAMYGAEMLRVDVPEIAAVTRAENRLTYGGVNAVEVEYPGMSAYTKFFGGPSIYCLTPCTEEVARRAVESMRKTPVSAVYMPELNAEARVVRPLLASGISGEDDEEDENRTDAGERW